MNDFSDIENDLQKLRPAQPSPVLFERIEEALAKHHSTPVVADTGRNWRRLLETPYNWGFALAAAAVLVLFAAISLVERRQEHGENVTQVSSAPETTQSVPASPKGSGIARTEPLNKFIPAGATEVVYNTRDEGLQFTNASPRPVRRLRYHSRQTWQWRNPTTGASLRVSYPSEEVVLIPVSGQ